jgi:hypothetical protein
MITIIIVTQKMSARRHSLHRSAARILLRLPAPRNKHPFSCFLILNDVRAGPSLDKFLYARFCILKGLHRLYEMQASVASHLEDGKGLTHPNFQSGTKLIGGQWGNYRINLACWV